MWRLSLLLPEYRNGPDSLMFECRLGRNCAAVVAVGAASYPFLEFSTRKLLVTVKAPLTPFASRKATFF